MSIRSKVRNVLLSAVAVLGAAGIVIVANQTPANLQLDCRMGEGFCIAILEPPNGQCPALFAKSEDPGPAARLARVLHTLEEKEAITAWETIARGAGTCFVEVRLSIFRTVDRNGNRRVDGQAPAWRDVVNASDLSSIVKDGRLSTRPAYARRSGCRVHVWYGEDPCVASEDVGGDPDPETDVGP